MANRIRVWVSHFPDRTALQLQWTCPLTGKRKTRSAKTSDPREAEARRVDLEASLNDGRYSEPSRLSWPAFRELFEAEYLSGCRASTRLAYAGTFAHFERIVCPSGLKSLDARAVSRFVAGLRQLPGRGAATMQASTIRTRLEHLGAALSWAKKQGLIPTVPPFPEVRVPRKRPQPVPAEAFERMLALADPEMTAFLLCGWSAGMRLAEALALERERTDEAPWLDLTGRRVWFPALACKGDADSWVPLAEDLRVALLALPRCGPRVFPWGISVRGAGQRVIRLARRAGVRLTMRSLRRGFLCRYAPRCPAQVLQRLGRHANITTTMDYYCAIDDRLVEAVLGNGSVNSPAPDPARPPRNGEVY